MGQSNDTTTCFGEFIVEQNIEELEEDRHWNDAASNDEYNKNTDSRISGLYRNFTMHDKWTARQQA